MGGSVSSHKKKGRMPEAPGSAEVVALEENECLIEIFEPSHDTEHDSPSHVPSVAQDGPPACSSSSASKLHQSLFALSAERSRSSPYGLDPSTAVLAQDHATPCPQRMAGHSRASRKPARTVQSTAVDIQLEPISPASPCREVLTGSPCGLGKLRSPARARATRLSSGHAAELSAYSQSHTPRSPLKEVQAWNLENCSPHCSPVRSPQTLKGSKVPRSPGCKTGTPRGCGVVELSESSVFELVDMDSAVSPIAPFRRT